LSGSIVRSTVSDIVGITRQCPEGNIFWIENLKSSWINAWICRLLPKK
jgi:hypothetical protein